ncbi:hypothetical protein Indivirus_1_180 [Indivirus ILV1]|uniref:NUDIX hydrolase n=1 Tax=Indivirus ILV1 TaxID=1977633 RepID=A0A1V0SCW5_9VIRU|nr:hypothetical protein Indivirus_1_180 [Indivirus ILV1]
MKHNNRPTFYLNDDSSCPVRAGGILFYRYDEDTNEYYLLMIHSRNKYEDFGGCSDIQDKSIEDMITREVEEESNGIFGKKYIMNLISKEKPIYIKYCKYVLYFIKINEIYDTKIFGDKEFCDGFYRTVEWIEYNNYKSKSINFRLNSQIVINHMNKLFV